MSFFSSSKKKKAAQQRKENSDPPGAPPSEAAAAVTPANSEQGFTTPVKEQARPDEDVPNESNDEPPAVGTPVLHPALRPAITQPESALGSLSPKLKAVAALLAKSTNVVHAKVKSLTRLCLLKHARGLSRGPHRSLTRLSFTHSLSPAYSPHSRTTSTSPPFRSS